MAARLDSQRLDTIFGSRPDILGGIRKAADTPSRISLFNEIASFVHEKLATSHEPASKRRRLDGGDCDGSNRSGKPAASQTLTLNAADVGSEPVLLEIKDISLSIPQRKKYDLCFTPNHLYARVAGAATPAQGIVYAWKDIAHIFFLPVPEKTQPQHNYVVLPRGACLPASKNAAPADEPLVFTVPAAPPKAGTITGPEAPEALAVSDTYQSLFHWAINRRLRAAGSKASIVASDPNVFRSASRQNVRPGEKPVHVKAFRGSKDGYLFLLPTGILWAFKKPLVFIPLDRIVAVSYTSVLQRTFNVVVEVFLMPGEENAAAAAATEELEFAMVDQEDYNGIDQNYVRRHKLQDRSMAEQRKAKLELAENAKSDKKGEGEGEGEDDKVDERTRPGGEFEGLTALQIAEREAERKLQDEEDEEEEDYEPSSDDSDGSGSSSEEEEEEEEGSDGGEEEEEDQEAEAEAESRGDGQDGAGTIHTRPVKKEPEDAVMADVPTTMTAGLSRTDDEDEDEHLDI